MYTLRERNLDNLHGLDQSLIECLNKNRYTKKIKKQKYKRVVASELVDLAKSQIPSYMSSYRLKKHKRIEFISDNPILSLNWALYKSLIKKTGNYHIFKKYNVSDRLVDFDLVKELSTYMLIHGPKVTHLFYLFVGLDHLFGFNYKAGEVDATKLVEEWVQNKFKPTLNGSESEYLISFRDKVRKLFEHKNGSLQVPYSAEEFCLQIPLTSTSGSAFDPGGPRETISYAGKTKSTTNNKFSKSAALSVQNKLKRLLTTIKHKAKVNQKIEVWPKIRLIISSDYNSFLKSRFVGTWFDQWMQGCYGSILWKNREQTLDMWLEMWKGKGWKIPIDQSKFDHHVSVEQLVIIIEEMKRCFLIHAIGNPEEIANHCIVYDNIILELHNTMIEYTTPEGQKIIFKYLSGVLSGWEKTAFFDTVANIAEKEVAFEQFAIKTKSRISTLFFDALGDDQNNEFTYLSDGLLYWLELSCSGFDIHPTKNFFSKVHNEYLRKYSTKDGINGYPARLVNKIMCLYPGKQAPETVFEKCNNLFGRWEKMAQRLCIPVTSLKSYYTSDMIASKLDKQTIKTFLYGDRVLGNMQLDERKIEPGRLANIPGTYRYHVTINGEGYNSFKKIFGIGQEREMNAWAIQSFDVRDLDLKDKDTIFIEDVEPIIPLDFIPHTFQDNPIKTAITKGWIIGDIMSANDIVMQRAFPDLKNYMLQSKAPKSWTYDYLLGRAKPQLPRVEGRSSDAISLISSQYENSLFQAMMSKRKTENKWQRLNKSYIFHLSKQIRIRDDLPTMFCL